jgi:hypothetical protein
VGFRRKTPVVVAEALSHGYRLIRSGVAALLQTLMARLFQPNKKASRFPAGQRGPVIFAGGQPMQLRHMRRQLPQRRLRDRRDLLLVKMSPDPSFRVGASYLNLTAQSAEWHWRPGGEE